MHTVPYAEETWGSGDKCAVSREVKVRGQESAQTAPGPSHSSHPKAPPSDSNEPRRPVLLQELHVPRITVHMYTVSRQSALIGST